MKLAADYSGLNFNELMELDVITHRIMVRDAFIYKMKQTDKGRDYLKDCWLLTQTAPDKDTLRKRFSNEESLQ